MKSVCRNDCFCFVLSADDDNHKSAVKSSEANTHYNDDVVYKIPSVNNRNMLVVDGIHLKETCKLSTTWKALSSIQCAKYRLRYMSVHQDTIYKQVYVYAHVYIM